jgi:hypothetical protein
MAVATVISTDGISGPRPAAVHFRLDASPETLALSSTIKTILQR